jgi:hypothetical protein
MLLLTPLQIVPSHYKSSSSFYHCVLYKHILLSLAFKVLEFPQTTFLPPLKSLQHIYSFKYLHW